MSHRRCCLNMVFIKGGLNVIISATVILLSGSAKLNFCTSNPALHKYQNRQIVKKLSLIFVV
jgi:hypothetical protein